MSGPRPSALDIWSPVVVDPLIAEGLTDASHAERFAQAVGDRLRYNHRRRLWLVYEAPRWRTDADGQVYRLALEFVRERQTAALRIADRKLKEKIVRFTIAGESKQALDRLVTLAKNFPPIADAGTDWDADPWISAAPNGVVDWQTGTLRPGAPGDRITRCLGVPFDPLAEAPRWQRFLGEVFEDDRELIGFIQR